MSYVPFSWPSIRVCVDGGGFVTGTIVTCSPWAVNRPSISAMYSPAESMAGKASTTMLVFSSLSFGVASLDPLEHPAASIVTATADAMSTFRDFMLAPPDIAGLLQQALRACSGGRQATAHGRESDPGERRDRHLGMRHA